MKRWSRGPLRRRRRRSPEEILAAAEERARRRLLVRARSSANGIRRLFESDGVARRHPYLVGGAAALVGAISAPVLVRALGGPKKILRRIRWLAGVFG